MSTQVRPTRIRIEVPFGPRGAVYGKPDEQTHSRQLTAHLGHPVLDPSTRSRLESRPLTCIDLIDAKTSTPYIMPILLMDRSPGGKLDAPPIIFTPPAEPPVSTRHVRYIERWIPQASLGGSRPLILRMRVEMDCSWSKRGQRDLPTGLPELVLAGGRWVFCTPIAFARQFK